MNRAVPLEEINAAITGKPEEKVIEYLTGKTVGEIEFIGPGENVSTYTYGDRTAIRRTIVSRCLICGGVSEHPLSFARKKLKNGTHLILCEHCSRLSSDKDLTGQTLYSLHVLYRVGPWNGLKTMWHVHCLACGGEYDIDQQHLGKTRSCTCGRKKGLESGQESVANLAKGGSAVHGVLRHNLNKNNTSGVRGVSPKKTKDGMLYYRTYINFRRKQYHLGNFPDLDSAIAARKEAEAHIYGNYLAWYAEHYPEQWAKYTERNPESADKPKKQEP